MGNGKEDAVPTKENYTKCMVIGDSIVRNVCTGHTDMTVEFFPGIKTEQLHRVIERSDLGIPETAIIHVGANDLRTTRNPDFVIHEV